MVGAGCSPISYSVMPLAGEFHDTTVTSQLVREGGARASSSAPSQGLVDWIMRVPLSAKLLGANLLVAVIALAALFMAHARG